MAKYFLDLLRVSGSFALFLVFGCSVVLAQTKQEHVHHMGQA